MEPAYILPVKPPAFSAFPPASGNGGSAWELATDAELAMAAAVTDRAGKEAFVEIVRRHQTAVCAVAWSVTGRIGLVDDIAQETFFKAWKRLSTLREPAKLRAWLTRIAHDCAVDAIQGEKSHLPLDEPAPGLPAVCGAARPDSAAAEAEEEALVWSSLAALPETLRTPLVSYYREGQSVAAVAAALDLSEDAVKQRLSRGRQALRAAVETRIETVLGRIQPSALLIVTIAAGIGLLAKPAAIAAGVTAAAATASAGGAAGTAGTMGVGAAGTTAAATATSAGAWSAAGISTFMTATSWLAAAITLAAFFPLGWKANGTVGASGADKAQAALSVPSATGGPFAAFPNSKFLAEWRRLHLAHGSGAAAMPVLHAAIQAEADAFRREALNVALLAEWAAVDPGGAFQNLWSEKKNTEDAAQLMRAWLKRDPDQAAGHLLAHLNGAETLTTAIAGDLAVLAPAQFIAILSALPEPPDDPRLNLRLPEELAEAFSEFARRDLPAAVEALPRLKGLLLNSARTSVARRMAEKDPVSAMAWARALDSKAGGETAAQAVIDVWAKADPAAALASLDSSDFSKSLADRVIAAIAGKDLPGALKEWSENPEKFGYGARSAISSALNRQFAQDPMAAIGMLENLPEKNRTELITVSGSEAESRYGHLSPEAAGAVWDWIRKQPPAGLADGIGNGLLVAEMRADPQAAIRHLASLPENWQVLLCTCSPTAMTPNMRLIQNSLGGAEFEQMLSAVAPAARGQLLATFFGKSDPAAMPDPALWRQRLDELPPETQARAAAGYTGSLTETDPQLAAAFAESLSPGPVREAAYSSMMDWWVSRDSHAASAWLDTLPPGRDRDAAAAGLVKSLPFRDAEAALTWAATISDDTQRLQCLTDFVHAAARSDPDRIPALLRNPLLSPADSQALSQKINPASPQP